MFALTQRNPQDFATRSIRINTSAKKTVFQPYQAECPSNYDATIEPSAQATNDQTTNEHKISVGPTLDACHLRIYVSMYLHNIHLYIHIYMYICMEGRFIPIARKL
jgi:hypothetical protein